MTATEITGLFNNTGFLSVQVPQDEYLRTIQMYRIPSFIRKFKDYWKKMENVDTTFLPGKVDTRSNIYKDEVEYRVEVPLNLLVKNSGVKIDQLNWESIAAVLYYILAHRSKCRKITIAHRFHRRDLSSHFNMADDVGYYAGDIPITLDSAICNDTTAARENLVRVRSEMMLGGVEYELLSNLEEIKPSHEATKVRLNYQPLSLFMNNNSIHLLSIDTFLYEPDDHMRPYDLDCIIRQNKERLLFIICYNKNHYTEDLVQSFVGDWIWNFCGNSRDARLSDSK